MTREDPDEDELPGAQGAGGTGPNKPEDTPESTGEEETE